MSVPGFANLAHHRKRLAALTGTAKGKHLAWQPRFTGQFLVLPDEGANAAREHVHQLLYLLRRHQA
jgi:hypothetical protein